MNGALGASIKQNYGKKKYGGRRNYALQHHRENPTGQRPTRGVQEWENAPVPPTTASGWDKQRRVEEEEEDKDEGCRKMKDESHSEYPTRNTAMRLEYKLICTSRQKMMHYWWSSVLTACVLELVCCNWVVITMNLMLAPEHVPCHSSLNSSLGHCSSTGFLSNQPADWALGWNHSPRRAKGQEQAGLRASRLTLKAKKLLWDKLRTTVFWANSSSSFVRNSTDHQLALQTTRLGRLTAGQHTSKSTPSWQGNTGSMCYVGLWWQNSTDL